MPPSASELRVYAGLHAAAAKGDVSEIDRLIAVGEKPDPQDGSGRTPLIVAAHLRHHAAARTLLRLGANPNALDAQRYDIVTIAAVNGDVEMLKLALDGGADARAITSLYDGTALIAAAHLGHAEVVRVADRGPCAARSRQQSRLDRADRVDRARPWRQEPRRYARRAGKAGANLNLTDRQGVTPLALAKARGFAAMARILEGAGAR